MQVLTQQPDYQVARKYWNKLKERLGQEGSELVTNCHQLKMEAADGKQRQTDVATAETLLRLVQSVPSPRAEPIKLWLAKVGYERMQEMAAPALSLTRARETWQKHGRSEKWIQQRMTGQETRHKLTDYWAEHGIKPGEEFAILTNIIHQEWAGIGVKAHKLKVCKTTQKPQKRAAALRVMLAKSLRIKREEKLSAKVITCHQNSPGLLGSPGELLLP